MILPHDDLANGRARAYPAAMTEPAITPRKAIPTPMQKSWLRRGLGQPGGKLPLFDEAGQAIDPRTVLSCVEHGWAERWFANPLKPDWLVCKLTEAGRKLVD